MKHTVFLFLLIPTFIFAQYPASGNKQRLGYQTTGDGLIWRGVAADTVTKPRTTANAYFQLDTVNGILRRYIATKGKWQTVSGGSSLAMPFDSITFTPSSVAPATAELKYSSDLETLVFGADGMTMEIGQKTAWYVKNQSGATITKGTVVRAAGTLGSSGRILIEKMVANGTIPSKYLLGIAATDIANGDDGYVIHFGKLRQYNTNSWNAGDVLYASAATPGALTNVEPSPPNLRLPIAFVVHKHSTNGMIAIRIQTGNELHELHDVDTTGISQGKGLIYNSSLNKWEASAGKLITSADTAAMLSKYIERGDTANMLLKYPSTVGWGLLKSTKTIRVDSTLAASRAYVRTQITNQNLPSTYFPLAGGTLTGTGGAGYVGFPSQVTAPGTPASGLNVYTQGSSFNWKGTDGYERQFASTLTGGRTYTLPNASGTFALGTGTSTRIPIWTSANALGDSPALYNSTTKRWTWDSPSILELPMGTDAQRPSPATTSDFWYSMTSGGLEWYNGTRWAKALESTFNRGTATRVPFFDANGQVTESANLTYTGTRFQTGGSIRIGFNNATNDTASIEKVIDVNSKIIRFNNPGSSGGYSGGYVFRGGQNGALATVNTFRIYTNSASIPGSVYIGNVTESGANSGNSTTNLGVLNKITSTNAYDSGINLHPLEANLTTYSLTNSKQFGIFIGGQSGTTNAFRSMSDIGYAVFAGYQHQPLTNGYGSSWVFVAKNDASTATEILRLQGKDGNICLGCTNAQYQLYTTNTGAYGIPRGTVAQRPTIVASTTPMRFNTDSTALEYGESVGTWQQLATRTYARSLISALPTTNIYTTDGTLTGNRTLTGSSFWLNLNSNVGIKQATPLQELDVNGDLRVRDSIDLDVTPAHSAITGLLTRDATGWVGAASVGTGLSYSGGVLSNSVTDTWLGTRLPAGNVTIDAKGNEFNLDSLAGRFKVANNKSFYIQKTQPGWAGRFEPYQYLEYSANGDPRIEMRSFSGDNLDSPGNISQSNFYPRLGSINFRGYQGGWRRGASIISLPDSVQTNVVYGSLRFNIGGNIIGFAASESYISMTSRGIVIGNGVLNTDSDAILQLDGTNSAVAGRYWNGSSRIYTKVKSSTFAVQDATTYSFVHNPATDTTFIRGNLRLFSYGTGTKEAGDLSKTQSNYVSAFATDGTMLELRIGTGLAISGGVLTATASAPTQILAESYNTVTSTTSPVTLSSTQADNLINQGSTQATFTLNLPASPLDGQVCTITYNNAITTLTIDGNGNTIVGSAVTTAVAGSQRKFKFYTGIGWIKQY